jgi:hypothetical protein
VPAAERRRSGGKGMLTDGAGAQNRTVDLLITNKRYRSAITYI